MATASSSSGSKGKAAPTSNTTYELPWCDLHPNCCHTPTDRLVPRVEKYRPVLLDDIVGNTETVERLKIIAKDGNMPHIIISGLPGIGSVEHVPFMACPSRF
jgi:replication factor C subunit 2/4